MKTNVILALFGTLVGVTLLALIYPLLPTRGVSAPEFENLDDLRKAMLTDSGSNRKGSESVSLRAILQPHPSDKIIFTLKPDLNVRFQKVPLKTNSIGMRSAEHLPEKPSGTFRIALLGDSFAFGWGVERETIFAQVAEQELNRLAGGKTKVEILNFGVPGYSTFQEVALFEEIGLSFQPDAVLVYIVENDFGLPFYIRDLADKGTAKLVPGREFHRFDLAKNPDISRKKQELLEQMNANYALKRLIDVAEAKGIHVFLTVNPNRKARQVKGQMWAIGETRSKPNVTYIKLRKELIEIVEREGISEKALSLKGDPHPSAIRHKIMGKILARRILPFTERNS